MAEVTLTATARTTLGSATTRRLRNTGRIPGVIYGHGTSPTPISVDAREFRVALNTDAGANVLINLSIDGKKQLVLARELQKHPVRGTVAHVDFQVVRRNEQVQADVPLTFTGEATKVTKMGGIVEHILTSLSVTATPTTMPAHIEVDLSELELDGTIRVGDLSLFEGVTTAVDPEEVIVVGKITRAALSPEEEAVQSGDAGAEGAAGTAAGGASGDAAKKAE